MFVGLLFARNPNLLCELSQAALRQWWSSNNKTLPQRIIYFRDGISEGQYVDTGEYEEQHIRREYFFQDEHDTRSHHVYRGLGAGRNRAPYSVQIQVLVYRCGEAVRAYTIPLLADPDCT